MNKILLIDSFKEKKSRIASFFRAIDPMCKVYQFSHKRQEETRDVIYQIERLDFNDKTHPVPQGESGFTLRLRHGGDYSNEEIELPAAALEICYGGDVDDTRPRKGEKRFYVPVEIHQEGQLKNFTIEDARHLLNFASGKTIKFPTCLLPDTYDEALERSLRKKISGHIYNWSGRLLPVLQEQWENKYPEYAKQTDLLFGRIKKDPKILILWNTEGKVESNIYNERIEVCYSRQSFQEKEINEFDIIIISAALKWRTDDYLTSFVGVDYASKLRRNGFLGLVIIASYMKWEFFQNLIITNPVRYGILNTPFTWYYPLEETDEPTLEKLPSAKMSTALLWDIHYYILDTVGALHSAFHGLKGRINRMAEETEMENQEEKRAVILQLIDRFFNEILPPLVAPDKVYSLKEIHDQVKDEFLLDDSAHPYYDIVQSSFNKVKRLVPLEGGKYDETYTNRDWGVLYVDDFKDRRIKVQSLLQASGITCFTASTGDMALKILEMDRKGELTTEGGNIPVRPNFISLLIADYRLLYEGGRWQTLQGYELIQLVAQDLDNFLSFAILTDKRGVIFRHARRNSKVEISWFSKELLIGLNSQNYFVNEILEIGQYAFEGGAALSENEVWVNGYNKRTVPLKPWYGYYRSLSEYQTYELRINEIVQFYLTLSDLLLELENPDHSRDTATITNEVKFYGQSIRLNPLRISLKFSTRLRNSPQQKPSEIQVFLNRLLGRRVIVALANLRSEPIEQLAELKGKNTTWIIEKILLSRKLDFENGSKSSVNHALFSYHFALPVENWNNKSAWLPEERNFYLTNKA